MNSNFVRKDEQVKFIMECRQSGLSDYQWCKTKGIHPGTFYNWVSKLRKAGYTFPESESKNIGMPVTQEVVKVDMLQNETAVSIKMEQNANLSATDTMPSVVVEILLGNFTLRLFNGADPLVIHNTLQYIGGMTHAW